MCDLHFEHLTVFPASESLTRKVVLQASHLIPIAMPCSQRENEVGAYCNQSGMCLIFCQVANSPVIFKDDLCAPRTRACARSAI